MRELIVATKNAGKLREIRALLSGLSIKVTSLADYPSAPEIVEDGATFAANAAKKALTVSRYTGKLVMGEDSGLEVASLDNAPGVYSARFSGPQATDHTNNLKLLRALRGVPLDQRQARYRCCVAIAEGDTLIQTVSGRCSGLIGLRPRGTHGFGYDPLFLLPRYQQTFGELDPAVKSRLSHRARALKKLRAFFEAYAARPA